MSSIEAAKYLLAGDKTWRDYVAQTSGVIDLTFVDLSNADLRHRVLERCDFTGAQLQSANCDHTTFDSCSLSGANFTNASLVKCELRNINAHNMIAVNTVVRESVFNKVDFTESNMSSAAITSTQFRNCTFVNLHKESLFLSGCKFLGCAFSALQLSRFSIHDCKMHECSLSDCNLTEIQIKNTIIEMSTIARFNAETGSVVSSGLIGCSISDFSVGKLNSLCQYLNVSRSTLTRINLKLLGLDSAIMLNTALALCSWPKQKGHVTIFGKYVPSPFLLAQPVQDIFGVNPLMRREIADAQYLVCKIENGNTFGRLIMRLWGLFTGFGQSLSRLLLSTLVLIATSTIMLLASRNELFGDKPDFQLLGNAAIESFDAFFALTNIPQGGNSAELMVTMWTHICGFVVLGFLVSILSLRLSRLGRE